MGFLSPFSKKLKSPRIIVLYWVSILLVSLAWWVSAVSLYFGNRDGIFATRALTKGSLLFPLFLISVYFIAKKFVIPKSGQISKRECWLCLITCFGIAVLILGLFPLPKPAIQQQGTVQIISEGQKNPQSQGAQIEIRQVNFLDGTRLPVQEFQLSGDWQIIDETLFSSGEQLTSTAVWSGKIPAGIVLNIRHNLDAGKLVVIWDGNQRTYDLYAPQSITTRQVFKFEQGMSTAQFLWIGLFQGLVFIGLFSFLYLLGLAVETKWPSPTLVYVVLGFIYVLMFGIFVVSKLNYQEFSAIRVFRDTMLYAETAGESWGSMRFWAGSRPFSYPLVLKLFGIRLDNYSDAVNNADVVQFQYAFSIISWASLGLVFSLRGRKLWLRPLVFGLILFYSLNLEVSIWESLVLTESLSISLFIFLLALWLWWDRETEKNPRPLSKGLISLILVGISILYIFTRESNQYFVIFGALIFPIAGLMRKAPTQRQREYWAYFLVIVVIIVTKNIAFNVSNLWQIHIYDHLALRLLHDDDAREYFQTAGLPIDQNLMQITEMPAYEYQDYLANDPEMDAVRDWINTSAVSTYMKYLLSRPISSMLEPFRNLPTLLGGDNLEYHFPPYGVSTIPQSLIDFTNRIYPRAPFVMWGFLVVSILGVIGHLLLDVQQSVWLIIAVLLITLYPLLFIVWHGNPMEIERHAAQIGIQYRLMGWMSIALLLDHLALGEVSNLVMKRNR